jgi:hypothetical protein
MLVFKQVLPEKPAQQVRILRLYVYLAFARVSWTRWLLDHVPSVFNFGRFHCVAFVIRIRDYLHSAGKASSCRQARKPISSPA